MTLFLCEHALISFSGKEEETAEFTKTLLEKYREFGEFNAKALGCKSLAEFKSLADENGIKFDSDEEANELFLGLSKGKKEVEKAIISAEEMSTVSGGKLDAYAEQKEKIKASIAAKVGNQTILAMPAVARRQASTLGRIQGLIAIGSGVASFFSIIVGTIAGAFNDDATFLYALPYQLFSAAFGALGVGLLNLPGTVLPGQ